MSAPLMCSVVKKYFCFPKQGGTLVSVCIRNFRSPCRIVGLKSSIACSRNVLPSHVPNLQPRRHAGTFFSASYPATKLWGSVNAVSNAGKRRGRGKRVGKRRVVDLNKGQKIGTGKANILWPGLNARLEKWDQLKPQQLPPDPDRDNLLVAMRDKLTKISYPPLPPLLRGWSGKRLAGQTAGSLSPVHGYKFEGFESRILEFKTVAHMTGTLGRMSSYSVFVVVGNKNGLAGFGLGKSTNSQSARRQAKSRAAQRLQYIERFEGHTVFHNFFTQNHRTKIFVHKVEDGYGLRCHRALKTICEMIGIKNLHAKVEASTGNIQCLTRAFFEGLSKQETYQQLADRMGYNVVEYRAERDNLPVVLARPLAGLKTKEALIDEERDIETDFERLYYNGQTEYKVPKKLHFYHNFNSYRYKRALVHKRRNQLECQIVRLAGLG